MFMSKPSGAHEAVASGRTINSIVRSSGTPARPVTSNKAIIEQSLQYDSEQKVKKKCQQKSRNLTGT